MMAETMVTVEADHVRLAVKNIREMFHFKPTMPDLEVVAFLLAGGTQRVILTPEVLEAFAEKRGEFSTADVMQEFQVNKYKVAGCLAPLSRTGKIKLSDKGPTDEGYSRYVYTAPKMKTKTKKCK